MAIVVVPSKGRVVTVFVALILTACYVIVHGGSSSGRHYKPGEHVDLWVNWVGPRSNPQELYEYYTLPYCNPAIINNRSVTFKKHPTYSMAEQIQGGYFLRQSGYDIAFNKNNNNQSTSSVMITDSGGEEEEEGTEFCETAPLTEEEVQKLDYAIRQNWDFEMYLDDLPIYGKVGEVKLNFPPDSFIYDSTTKNFEIYGAYVYTSLQLTIYYHGDQIIRVDPSQFSLKDVKAGQRLRFELQVLWVSTEQEYHTRSDRYFNHRFFPRSARWVCVQLSLALFVYNVIILARYLKRDYVRYSRVARDVEQQVPIHHHHHHHPPPPPPPNDKTVDIVRTNTTTNNNNNNDAFTSAANGDTGWKQVHGDVFRAPSCLPFFSAMIGTGWQLIALTVGVGLYAAIYQRVHGDLLLKRGGVIHAILVGYLLSSIVAGYQSGRLFKLYYPTSVTSVAGVDDDNNGDVGGCGGGCCGGGANNKLWRLTAGFTVMLFPTATTLIMFVLNIVARYYSTIKVIPNLVIAKLFLMWVFISAPLCVAGFLFAVRQNDQAGSTAVQEAECFPCRVNSRARPLPKNIPFRANPFVLILLSVIVIFTSLYIELYYVFSSLWIVGYTAMNGISLGVYMITVITVGMNGIFVVYMTLNAENWKWHWIAFGGGASTGLFVFLFGIYYFLARTSMHGMLQTSFYFGYLALISIYLGLIGGTIAHAASTVFVRAIFKNLKID